MNPDPLKNQKNESEKEPSSDSQPLPYFPEETWLQILYFLDLQSLARFSSVSQHGRLLAADNRLWKSFLGDLSSLGLENEKAVNYKELVKNKIIFDRRKAIFKKTHQAFLEPPPLSEEKNTSLSFHDTIVGKKTPMETFEAIVTNGTQGQLESFIIHLDAVEEKKNPPIGTLLRILQCALNNSPDTFKRVCQYIFTKYTLKEFITDKNLWLFAKFFQHKIPIEMFLINRYHPIFHAIDQEQWLLVEFFILFYPSCLGLAGTVSWPDTRIKTVIQHIFEKNLTLGMSLIPSCCFLDKKLSSEVKRLLAINLTEKHLPNFKRSAPFINLTQFEFEDYKPTTIKISPTHVHRTTYVYNYVSILDYYVDTFESQLEIADIRYKVYEVLVAHCQSIINNYIDKENNTVLHKAANLKLLRTCKLLLENGANPNKPNSQNETILHIISRHSWSDRRVDELNIFLPRLINDYAADLTKENKEGKTPIQIALEKLNTSLLKIFILQCHASKLITAGDIEASYNAQPDNQILANEKSALLLILHQQKKAEKRQLEYNIAAAGGITKPKEKNIQLDELDPNTSFMGIIKR